MSTEGWIAYAAIATAGVAYWLALKRHRKRPQARMWNPFDPREAQPGEPVFGPGLRGMLFYAAGFALTAVAVRFLIVHPA
jgi:hypothetical protein